MLQISCRNKQWLTTTAPHYKELKLRIKVVLVLQGLTGSSGYLGWLQKCSNSFSMHRIRGVVGWLFPMQNEGMTGISLFNAQFSRMTFGLLHDSGYDIYMRGSTKQELWILDWTMDWALESIMYSIIGLEFQSPVTCKLLISILSMFCDVIAAWSTHSSYQYYFLVSTVFVLSQI